MSGPRLVVVDRSFRSRRLVVVVAGASFRRRCQTDMRGLVTAGRGVRLEGDRWSRNVGRRRRAPVAHRGVAGFLHAAKPDEHR